LEIKTGNLDLKRFTELVNALSIASDVALIEI
jgi:hypothetical protein